MSGVQLENLWQYIQSLSLSRRNRQWLAERLMADVELDKTKASKEAKKRTAKAETLEAIAEAKAGKVTTFTSFDQFKQHLYEL